jgi:hypothetical protein
MSNLAEKSEKNPVTTETEEKKWELFESREARLRDQKHLEMAYEWLRNRGKMAQLQGAVESL